jgi:hypothetical protein
MTQYVHFPNQIAITGPVTIVQPSGANLHVDVDDFPAVQLETPEFLTSGILSLSAGTTGYRAFASQPCKQLTISNQRSTAAANLSVQILCQLNGVGPSITIPSGMAFTFYGLTNANQVAVDANTVIVPFTCRAVWSS